MNSKEPFKIHNTTTLDDIANYAQLSRMTVYKVLNNKGKVKQKNIDKVKRACEELNYQVNMAARNLAMNKALSICCSYFLKEHNHFFDQLAYGMRQAFTAFKDYRLEVSFEPWFVHDEIQSQADIIYTQFKKGIRHFVVIPYDYEPIRSCIDELTDKGALFITLNRDCEDAKRISYVGCDYYASGRLCGEILTKTSFSGTLLIPITEEFEQDKSTIERKKGIIDAMKDSSIFSSYVEVLIESEEALYRKLRPLLAQGEITAIADLSGNLPEICACIRETGMFEKISVVGYDLELASSSLLLSGDVDCLIDQNLSRQGYLAIKNLFQHCSFGYPIERQITSPIVPIFKENLSMYQRETRLADEHQVQSETQS